MGFSSSRFDTGKSMEDKKETTNSNSPKIEDLVHIHKFPDDGKWHLHRLIGGIQSYCFWWLPLKTRAGKVVNIPKQALAWDEINETDDTSKPDPYRDAVMQLAPMFPDEGKQRHRNAPRYQPHFYINTIPRETQDDYNPAKNRMNDAEQNSGYKDINNDRSRTPVEVIKLPPTAAAKVASLKQMNTHTVDGETRQFSVAHPKYGCDVAISYDSSKQGAAQYDFNLRNPTPLNDEEYDYLIWKLDGLLEPEDVDTAKREGRKIIDSHSQGGGGFSRANSSDDFDNDGGGRSTGTGRSRRSELDDFEAPPARNRSPGGDREERTDRGREEGNRVARDDGESSTRRSRPAPEESDTRASDRGREDDTRSSRTETREVARDDAGSSRRSSRLDPDDNPESGGREEPRGQRQEARRDEPTTRASGGEPGGRKRDNFDL